MYNEILWIIILAEFGWVIWLGNRPAKHQFDIDDFLKIKHQFDKDTKNYKEDMATFGFKSLEVEYVSSTNYGNAEVKKITLNKK